MDSLPYQQLLHCLIFGAHHPLNAQVDFTLHAATVTKGATGILSNTSKSFNVTTSNTALIYVPLQETGKAHENLPS